MGFFLLRLNSITVGALAIGFILQAQPNKEKNKKKEQYIYIYCTRINFIEFNKQHGTPGVQYEKLCSFEVFL
jgi:hypothetical protein